MGFLVVQCSLLVLFLLSANCQVTSSCEDESVLCNVRINADPNFCSDIDLAQYCKATCGTCGITNESPATSTIIPRTTTAPTTITTAALTTTPTTTTTTTPTTTTTTTTTTPTTTMYYSLSPNDISFNRAVNIKITSDDDYNIIFSATFLNNDAAVKKLDEAVSKTLEELNMRVKKIKRGDVQLGYSSNNRAVRLTRRFWKVEGEAKDASTLSELVAKINKEQRLGFYFHRNLPSSPAFTLHKGKAEFPNISATKKPESSKDNNKWTNQDWRVIGGVIGAALALILIVIITAVVIKRNPSRKDDYEVEKAYDFDIKLRGNGGNSEQKLAN